MSAAQNQLPPNHRLKGTQRLLADPQCQAGKPTALFRGAGWPPQGPFSGTAGAPTPMRKLAKPEEKRATCGIDKMIRIIARLFKDVADYYGRKLAVENYHGRHVRVFQMAMKVMKWSVNPKP